MKLEGMKLRAPKPPSVAWKIQTPRHLKVKEVVSLNWGGTEALIDTVLTSQ